MLCTEKGSPPGAPECRVGWSCPAVTCTPLESPLPAPTVEMAGLSQCPSRTHRCPHWSARSHTPPLQENTFTVLTHFSLVLH